MTNLPSLMPTEDFWARQASRQISSFDLRPFGIPARITANKPEVLAAARLSAGRFSSCSASRGQSGPWQAAELAGQPIQMQVVVGQEAGGPAPADLPEQLKYAGVGEWITLSAGAWGHGFANLATYTALIFLSSELAAETRLVSRYFIDHYLLNFILTEWAMLHASGVLDPQRQRLIMLVAPHNAGKSTTALHLLRAGYLFLADGMVLLRPQGTGFLVGGYPIGEVKLRADVLTWFPEYEGEAVTVREQRKTVVNLRAAHPHQLAETLFSPSAIQICFIERDPTSLSQVTPLSPAEAGPILAANTVYWNEAPQLVHNTTTLHALLQSASLYRLKLGTDVAEMMATVAELT